MSVKQEERCKQILAILAKQERADVADLSKILGVSQVTVRKDLDELEAGGFIVRLHGSARLNTGDHISSRLAYHYEEKKKVALAASELVGDGDTVMIESGSCCAILARHLAETRRDLTIITNSAFIADYIRACRQTQVFLLGGLYQQDSQCLVGPMIRESVKNFHVRYFFMGTDGWSLQTGFTNKDPLRAQAVRDMAASCDEMIVLTESEKFSEAGTVPLKIECQPRKVITDARIPADAAEALAAQGIEVL